MDFIAELSWRGLVHSKTNGADDYVRSGSATGYIGFDPTASSLHVGSLLPIMGLVHFQRAGHSPIAIAGGGTGMIGDPSGKASERKLLSVDEIDANLLGIRKQLARMLDFDAPKNPARIVNNADWLTKLSMMQFLRDVGKHFSVNEMMAKESVRSRIQQEQGMSFTEFSYSLLQAYDYLELYDRHRCTIQMGGSDQWGNIISGIDLIRRLRGAEVHGIVFPLITTSSGVKFGKTESGAVWLDPSRTSPYRFYQYWLNAEDMDVIRFLKFFTLLTKDEIEAYQGDPVDGGAGWLPKSPETRAAQRKLAEEVTQMIHGPDALAQAVRASQVLFGGDMSGVSAAELVDIFADVPSSEIPAARLQGPGLSLAELMTLAGAATSKGDARRTIQGGGAYLNNNRVTGDAAAVTMEDTIEGKFIVLRKGGKNYFLVKILS